MPRRVIRELERQIRDPDVADRAALALSIGAAAIDEDLPEVAVRHLEWVKHVAPRSVEAREALGIAYYHAGEYAAAATEMQAYRRLSGQADQNHVLADALRAQRRNSDRIAALVEEMLAADGVAIERRTEGVIVWAASLADSGDIAAARAVLRRFAADHPDLGGDALDRLRYVAADLAERGGDAAEARRLFRAVAASDGDFLDVAERLRRLA